MSCKAKRLFSHHHGHDGGTQVKIDSRDCTIYMTELGDPNTVLLDALDADRKNLWWEMTSAAKVVKLLSDVSLSPSLTTT